MVSHNLMLSRSSSSRVSQSPPRGLGGPLAYASGWQGGSPPRTDPQSATTVGVRSPLWFLSAERATWLILPVAYACLKD